jgi:hypothetical protein
MSVLFSTMSSVIALRVHAFVLIISNLPSESTAPIIIMLLAERAFSKPSKSGSSSVNVMNIQPGFSYDRYATDYIWEDHARSSKRQLGTVLEHLLYTSTAVH